MSRCLPGLAVLLALPAAAPAQYLPCFAPVAVPVHFAPFVSVAPPPVVVSPPPVCPAPAAPAAPGVLAAPEVPAVPATPSAPPSAAPPSSGPLPYSGEQAAPPSKPMPPADSPTSATVQVSKVSDPASYDVYPVASRGGAPATDRALVCFWNLSGRDLTLQVAGRTRVLPPGGRERLRLERRFTWQVGDREPRDEEVAAGGAGLEIVLRR